MPQGPRSDGQLREHFELDRPGGPDERNQKHQGMKDGNLRIGPEGASPAKIRIVLGETSAGAPKAPRQLVIAGKMIVVEGTNQKSEQSEINEIDHADRE